MCDKPHYDALDERVTALEGEVAELRSETRTGFSSVNANIETLSQQITNMDKRIVEEKVRWGEVLRSIVMWTVRTVLAGCTAAMGMTAYKMIIG